MVALRDRGEMFRIRVCDYLLVEWQCSDLDVGQEISWETIRWGEFLAEDGLDDCIDDHCRDVCWLVLFSGGRRRSNEIVGIWVMYRQTFQILLSSLSFV